MSEKVGTKIDELRMSLTNHVKQKFFYTILSIKGSIPVHFHSINVTATSFQLLSVNLEKEFFYGEQLSEQQTVWISKKGTTNITISILQMSNIQFLLILSASWNSSVITGAAKRL